VASQKVREDGQEIEMSKQYPECPLSNHVNCKDLYSPKLCALARKDKKCLRKLTKHVQKAKK
jgi:hypothetical protein